MTKHIPEATAWNPYPNRIWPAVPTLALTTKSEVTDADVGLPHDPKAQLRAEGFIRAALSYQAKQAQRTAIATRKAVAIRIALPAQDDETSEIIPDSVEMIGAIASQDRWSQ